MFARIINHCLAFVWKKVINFFSFKCKSLISQPWLPGVFPQSSWKRPSALMPTEKNPIKASCINCRPGDAAVGPIESVFVGADKELQLLSVSGGLPQPIGDSHAPIAVCSFCWEKCLEMYQGWSCCLAVLENEYRYTCIYVLKLVRFTVVKSLLLNLEYCIRSSNICV